MYAVVKGQGCAGCPDTGGRRGAGRRCPGGARLAVSAIESVRDWWAERVIGKVDQAEVIERRREDCARSERYLFHDRR